MRGFAVIIVMLTAIVTVGSGVGSDTHTAAVKVLTATPDTASEFANSMMATPIAPPATSPAERLPQYRLHPQRSQLAAGHVAAGQLPFVITSPELLEQIGRPLRVLAQVNIDGKPYSEVRGDWASSLRTSALDVNTAVEAATTEATTMKATANGETLSEQIAVDEETVLEKSVEIAEPIADNETTENPPVSPATVQPYAMANDPVDTIARYAAAVGEAPSDAEAKWLLDHWTEGPALLVVPPYFQNFRADQRPAFDVLDRDRDGVISKDESARAIASFRQCDANHDDVVDVLEIAKAADAIRDPAAITPTNGPLLWLLTDLIGINEADSLLYGSLSSLDTDQDGTIQETEITASTQQPADIELALEFHTNSPDTSYLEVVRVAGDLSAELRPSTQSGGIDVVLGTLRIQFCGVQESVSRSIPQAGSGQISLGAVVDGYPLLPMLDPNDAGRFTIRE